MDFLIQSYIEFMNIHNFSNFMIFFFWFIIEFIILLLLFAIIGIIFAFVKYKLSIFYNHNNSKNSFFTTCVAKSLKSLFKENIIPNSSDKLLFLIAPVLVFSSVLFLCALIPLSMSFMPVKSDANALLFFAIFSFSCFGILLSGYASDSKYSLLGALRYCLRFILTFIPILFSVIAIFILSGSMSFTDIVTIQHNFGILSWFFLPSFLGFIVFLISTIAIFKNSDDFVFFSAEYTGMKFTMFKISEYILAILLCILTVILYFGGYMPPIPIFIADLFEKSKFLYPFILTCEQTFWLILKSLLLFSTVFVFSKAIPKYKTEDLANIIWKFLIPLSILNIFIVCFFKLKLGGLYVL